MQEKQTKCNIKTDKQNSCNAVKWLKEACLFVSIIKSCYMHYVYHLTIQIYFNELFIVVEIYMFPKETISLYDSTLHLKTASL